MSEGPERTPAGLGRAARDSQALADLDLRDRDWRALIEQLPLAVYIDLLDEWSTNVYTSPQIEALLGYTAEEWTGENHLLLKILHPDDRDRVMAAHLRSCETGEPFRLEYRMVARDGRVVWFLDQATVVPGEPGRPGSHYGFLLDISQRKELEGALAERTEELARQKRYFESLLEISPVAIVTADLDDVVTSWNPAAERLFGYARGEAVGRKIDDLVASSPELRAEAVAVNREALAEGRVHAITRRTHKDGSLIDVELLAAPVHVRGEQVGTYATYHDVRERKRAEEALRRSEAELRRQKQYFESLVEISPTAVLTLDLDERVTSWNPAAERLFGYSKAEAVGRPIAELTLRPEDLGEQRVRLMRRVYETGAAQLTTRRRRKDGTLVDVEVLVVPLDMDGERVGAYVIYHDITELQRRRQYLESLLEISPVAIATTDLDDVVTTWNPAAERLFGYARGEAVGRKIDDLVASSPELHAEAAALTREALAVGRSHAITRRTHKDGSLIDVELLAAPVHVRGEQVGTYVIYHDITELLRARREAEAAAEAKSAFLATMSHEIRTPLNAVIGMTELLLGTELTAEQRGLAQVVHTSGDALLAVINEILDFSKIEAGRIELEHRPLVLRDCVETALELVAASAAAKGLEVACLVDPGAPALILGDSTRLGQILVNLLTNAVKFTERGEVVLTVESEADEVEDRHRLHFTVRDTGIGIPADRIDGLFDSFTQVDASTTRRFGGTGLGLAISRRLCELMGGEMWAESEPGQGSAFHFTLPAEAVSGPELPPVAAELRGKRLLVVDDNAANREVVTRQARSWGMLPRETGSPAQALEWIRRGDPLDVAILDMQMPQIDGLTLASEIRRYRDAEALPLVMLTSLGRRSDDRDARGEFAAVLTKPIRGSQLCDAVAAAVGAKAADAQDTREADLDAIPATRPQLRVLLAEDNAVNRQLALRLLEKLGHEADVAVNGLEALEALRRRPYDAVLMDVEMPEMDGLEASRRIHREWRSRERPRIVAMTAHAMQGDRETCLAAGMDDYVSKPIHLDELAAALRRCEPRVLDHEALEQLRAGGDEAFFVELVDTFLLEAPTLLATLRRAEAHELRRAAHTLKSNARVFGATRLADLCQELEAMAHAASPSGAGELVARIDGEYARVAEALQAAKA